MLYTAHYRRLVRLAALLLDDVGTSEEVVQDAYVKMHSAWRRLRDPQAGIGVTLGRINPAGQRSAVTTVYLVRVASGHDEPYVVVRANAPGLTLAADPLGPGRVSGGITGVEESILIRLLTAGTGRQVASGRTQAGGQDAPWQAPVDYHRASAGSHAVVAQTDSPADGDVARITVAPARI